MPFKKQQENRKRGKRYTGLSPADPSNDEVKSHGNMVFRVALAGRDLPLHTSIPSSVKWGQRCLSTPGGACLVPGFTGHPPRAPNQRNSPSAVHLVKSSNTHAANAGVPDYTQQIFINRPEERNRQQCNTTRGLPCSVFHNG